MLQFYWELGRDIVEKKAESRWGSGFMKNLSRDLKEVNPDATCFSETNLLYMKNFYQLYQPYLQTAPQVGEQITQQAVEQKENAITPQLVEQIQNDLFSVPWGHHRFIIDKFKEQPEKALFFVHQTVENGWSRDMLLNFMGTDLYERQGKALTNFQRTLPEETSDLARELTKDPYDFAFTGITGKYNEALLKEKLLSNITQFLVELGTGFGYLGKEYRLQVGEREQFIDLLFYNLNLSCYVVIDLLCCAQHNNSQNDNVRKRLSRPTLQMAFPASVPSMSRPALSNRRTGLVRGKDKKNILNFQTFE